MIRTLEQAHAALADSLWWLKGFSAAAQAGGDEARGMADDLRETREWLDRITEGNVRRLGDEKAIILTYAEFEAIYDYVGHIGTSEAEKGLAVDTVRKVLAQYREEGSAARNQDEIPF